MQKKSLISINYRLMPIVAIFMIVSILCASYRNVWLYAMFFLILSCFLSYILVYQKYIAKIICIILFMLIGFFSTFFIVENSYSQYKDNVQITCAVDSITDGANSIKIIVGSIECDGKKVNGKAVINLDVTGGIYNNLEKEISIGDELNFIGEIGRIRINPKNFTSITYYTKNVYRKIIVDEEINIGSNKLNLSQTIKRKILSVLTDNTKSNTAAMFYAMFVGDKYLIDDTDMDIFRSGGITHIFAVSGLHVGFIASALLLFLTLIHVGNFAKLIVLTISLLFYAFICDFSPSVVRASLMTILYLIAKLIYQKNETLSIISLSAIIYLSFKPLSLFSASFVMSYVAVLGIAAFYRSINKLLSHLPSKLRSPLTTSLSVNIALLPVSAILFSSFTPYFLFPNLIIVPLLGFIFVLSIVFIIFTMLFPTFGKTLIICDWFYDLTNKICGFIYKLPYSYMDFDVNVFIIIIYFILLLVLSRYIMANKHVKEIAVAFLCIILFTTCGLNISNGFVKQSTITNRFGSYIIINYNNSNIIATRTEREIISAERLASLSNVAKIDYQLYYGDNITPENYQKINAQGLNIDSLIIKSIDETLIIESNKNIYIIGNDINPSFAAVKYDEYDSIVFITDKFTDEEITKFDNKKLVFVNEEKFTVKII